MERRSIEAIAGSLNDADVRYRIVGGVAVVAHGFVRFTADLDLVLDTDRSSLERAAGRPQDLIDVTQLESLAAKESRHGK